MREVKRNHSVIFNVPSKTSVTDSIPTLEGSIGENEMPKRMSFAHRASIAVQTLRKGSIVAATTIWKQFRGVFYAFISSLLFSINSLIVKRLTGIDPALIASIRFAETGILAIAAIPEVNIDSIFGPPDSRICVFLRALTGATALYLRFVALKLLPLSNATVIKLTTPAFVSFFSVFILRESCGLGRVLTFTVTVIGIALTTQWHIILFGVNPHAIPSKVSQENDDRNSLMIGMSCGIIASMIGSLTVILLRKLKDVHHSVTLFNTSWIALIEMTAIAYFTDAYHLPECGPAPWFLMAVGVTSFFGQMMLTKALQVEEAGVVSMFKSSCDLILAFAYQILFFDHYPDGLTIFGSLLVLSGVLLTAIRKYLITLSKDKPLRQALNFLI